MIKASEEGEKKMSGRKGLRVMRGAAQLTFLGLFVAAAWAASYPPAGTFQENIYLRAEPLNAILSRGGVFGITFILPAIILLLLTLPTGRFFCGWICPLGTCFDFLPSAGRHGKRSLKKLRPRGINGAARESGTRRLRLKYVLLALLIILYIVNINLLWFLNPVVIANRAVIFVLTGAIPLVFIALVLLAMVYKPRYWCEELCPTGALFSAVSAPGRLLPERLSPLALRKDETACTHCGKCAVACPFEITEVADSRKTGRLALADCALCGDCVAACPCDNALSLTSFSLPVYSSGLGGACELVKEEVGG